MNAHMPTDHPKVPMPKVGILFANLGTPDNYDYWSMRRYLNEFLSDKRVIDYPNWKWQPILQGPILTIRPFRSGANYKMIWNHDAGESPLMTITKQQVTKLDGTLTERFGDRVMVDFCMRYGNPSTKSKVAAMVAAGCTKILFFPLYPQYSATTSGTANDQFFRALMEESRMPSVRTAPEYFDRDDYIEALAASILRVYPAEKDAPERIICSYHGMPERYLMEGDPYHCQCQKTTRLLAERLGWARERIATTFQSVFGPEEWLKPYTVDEVARLVKEDGVKSLAVLAPAFSADCIETLEEINGEIRESFEHAGGETFTYIPCLNDDDEHVAALTNVVVENLRGWLE
ncbi:ferrochelatase [Maritimibacter sp. UBA3975]|uniref:ferrochelatase n=1 Tax=Maritimibacter sp. UBA3975 TaxID=1946833 RepID=UPI000C094530|nr:ferrochelatase [Maritimibacter sp. UBA3975]MAM63456.1 ferrochelatase [Maritimibacter sp.]|tara:strand:- start:24984 stop:26021 length:1038 start_codon:yes stop_codon:yes gene_type:complete